MALEPDERDALLDRECGADDALRSQVERLLAADDSMSFLEQDAAVFASPALDEGALHERIGPPVGSGHELGAWRLLHEIGQGGSSIVYLADIRAASAASTSDASSPSDRSWRASITRTLLACSTAALRTVAGPTWSWSTSTAAR